MDRREVDAPRLGLCPNKLICPQCGATKEAEVDPAKHRMRGNAFSPLILCIVAAGVLNMIGGFLR
jgi:uncharacterized paraquat-inducible protein A